MPRTSIWFLLITFMVAASAHGGKPGKPSSGSGGNSGSGSGSSSSTSSASTAAPTTPSIPLSTTAFPCQWVTTTDDSDLSRKVSDLYIANNWDEIQSGLRDVIGHIGCGKAGPLFDLTKDSISILLLDDANALPTPSLARVLIQMNPQPDLSGVRVTGKMFYSISILPDIPDYQVKTTFAGTPVPNPLLASVSSAASKIGSISVPASAATVASSPTGKASLLDMESKSIVRESTYLTDFAAKLPPEKKPAATKLTVFRIDIPSSLTRLQISAVDTIASADKDVGRVNDIAHLTDTVMRQLIELAGQPKPATLSPKELITDACRLASKANEIVLSARPKPTPRGRLLQPGEVESFASIASYAATLAADVITFRTDLSLSELTCAPPPNGDPTKATAPKDISKAIQEAGKILADATFPDSTLPSLTSTYLLAPLTHFDFGLGAGAIWRTAINRQVKADSSGTPSDDTPIGPLTFVAVNAHPGYDESTIEATRNERMRVLLGVSLTPSPGGIVGIGYGWRGLSVTAGFGVLLANVLRSGYRVGVPPAQGQSPSPTRRGALGVWFAGIEYSLQ